MRRLLPALVAVASLCLVSSACGQEPAGPLPSPAARGDFPDPHVFDAQGARWAVTTSGPWAPTFRILRQDDGGGWRLAGAVFDSPPRWGKESFWAPEVAKLRNGYILHYSALPRGRRAFVRAGGPRTGPLTYCLGAATAPSPSGPWRDLGRPLHCTADGTIDPHVTRDERGRLHLLYKEDGNRFGRPTPILAQRLRADGRALLGEPRELLRNGAPWEGKVIEAPAVVRRDGFFYLFYSGALCCTQSCRYAVGVARSPTLFGRWRKFSGNPILRGGRGWRCPGHLSIAGDNAFFHAYRSGQQLAGRQLLVDSLAFSGGWPRIGSGRPVAANEVTPDTSFTDAFSGPLAPEWEWIGRVRPEIGTGMGLALRANRKGGARVDAGLIARRLGSARYTATTVIDRASLRSGESAGIASYRSRLEVIGIRVGGDELSVWQRRKGRPRTLATVAAPAGPSIHLRMVARGRAFSFEASPDGLAWTPVSSTPRAPVEDTTRLALTVGGVRGASARFVSAALVEN